MIRLWSSAQADVEAQKLLVLNMTLGCTLLALFLSNLDGTSWATYRIRMILMDYALALICTATMVCGIARAWPVLQEIPRAALWQGADNIHFHSCWRGGPSQRAFLSG